MIRGKIALFLLVMVVVCIGGVCGLTYVVGTWGGPLYVVQNMTGSDGKVVAESAENSSSDCRLSNALETGNIKEAKKLIREHQIGEDTAPHDWNTALAIAAPLKDKELITLIQEQGTTPDAALDYVQNAKQAEALVHLGATVQYGSSSKGGQWTHLGTHALNGNVEVVEWLLKHGAKASEKDEEGLTLLSQVEDSAKTAADPQEKAKLFKVVTLLEAHGATVK